MFLFALLVGLLMLITGAEMIVRGGGQLALVLRVPALVVGLTIVAFGTSAPELLVSVTAALSDSAEMALANVNGSNIANVLLVLGMAAIVRPLVVERSLLRREIPSCLLLQVLIPVCAWDGVVSRGDGMLLAAVGIGYNAWLMWEALRGRPVPVDDDLEVEDGNPLWRHGAMLTGGISILVVGANLFVFGAEEFAHMLGWSDRFIGLTVVALGTSAPEVATSMVSAHRGEVDLAVGASLGSNILNVSMVLGITAMLTPIHVVDTGAWSDMFTGVGATLLLVPLVWRGRVGRGLGLMMALAYVGFVVIGYLAS
ncbi:MAG: cation:H+ antiporter [Myxococcota bacterium]